MISLILYGRNDSYGYNLHKRAAISLNCMAEMLSDPADEIIFVDYNTPDDFPTFPEAIQDTLTERAKSILRILRVRPKHHERFRSKTHLLALEPVARNVAIRRSNPANRWILSTNTDMVFVPRRGKSLSEIAAGLADGYYHLPRFEVPETLWESVDRINPRATIASFEAWGRRFHLNEIVYAQEPVVYYDAPGDFQLMLRSDLWKIFGFDESMLLGWHVDSNMAKRLSLIHRRVGDVIDDVFGYHCDHTRQVTPMHKAQATQNDLKIYFDLVRSAPVRKQAKTWGLAGETIEELSISAADSSYSSALSAATESPLNGVTKVRYAGATFNQIDYTVDHVLPFLADSLSSYPRDAVVGWSGAKRGLLQGFARAWREMGFTKPILVFAQDRWLGPELPPGCSWSSTAEVLNNASVFVFDWGKPENQLLAAAWEFERDPIIRQVVRRFRSAVRHERVRLAKNSTHPRRFVGVNAINNAMEGVFGNHIGAARTPIATRIRQGFLAATTIDVLPSLYIGIAGVRAARGILPIPKTEGYVFYGPYLDLDTGTYSLRLQFADVRFESAAWSALDLEVVSDNRLLGYRQITRKDLRHERVSLDFYVPAEISDAAGWPRIEFRLKTPGSIRFRVVGANLERIDDPRSVDALRARDIAPALCIGPAGARHRDGVHALPGVADLVTFGPYFWLPRGRYEATFKFKVWSRAKGEAIRICIADHFGRTVIGRGLVEPRKAGLVRCAIAFDIDAASRDAEGGRLEFLTWSRGKLRFSLTSLRVRPRPGRSPGHAAMRKEAGVIRLLTTRRAGRLFADTIFALEGVRGPVFQGPKLPLPAGPQQLRLAVRLLSKAASTAGDPGFTIAALADHRVLAVHKIRWDELRKELVALDFDVPGSWGSDVELLLLTKGFHALELSAATLAEIGHRPAVRAAADFVALFEPAARASWSEAPSRTGNVAIRSAPGKGAIAAQGPLIALVPGNYELEFDLLMPAGHPDGSVKVDVVRYPGSHAIAVAHVKPSPAARNGRASSASWKPVTQRLRFNVPREVEPNPDALFEFRVWSSRKLEFYLTGVRLQSAATGAYAPVGIVARSP